MTFGNKYSKRDTFVIPFESRTERNKKSRLNSPLLKVNKSTFQTHAKSLIYSKRKWFKCPTWQKTVKYFFVFQKLRVIDLFALCEIVNFIQKSYPKKTYPQISYVKNFIHKFYPKNVLSKMYVTYFTWLYNNNYATWLYK